MKGKAMTIQKKVAQALYLASDCDSSMMDQAAEASIKAFLEAAAEEGWHMRCDEVTEKMVSQAANAPKMQAVDSAITIASVHGFNLEASEWADSPIADAYRAMLAAAPKFNW